MTFTSLIDLYEYYFTDQCNSGGTGPYRSALVIYILGRPVKFSNSRDADNLDTIRKRMPRPFQ